MTSATPFPTFDHEFWAFLNEIEEHNDRAVVILSAAQLDLMLRQLLESALLPSPTSDDELFDGERPLSSLSAKITLAYRLGLIDAALAKALHLVRKIRNAFAHEAIGCTLESGAHRERIRELVAPFRSIEGFDLLVGDGVAGKSQPKNEFRMAVAFMVVVLRHAPSRLRRTTQVETITLVPDVLKRYRIERPK